MTIGGAKKVAVLQPALSGFLPPRSMAMRQGARS